jgi:hypothetical protein
MPDAALEPTWETRMIFRRDGRGGRTATTRHGTAVPRTGPAPGRGGPGKVGAAAAVLRDAVRAADDETQVPAVGLPGRQLPSQLPARGLPAFFIEQHDLLGISDLAQYPLAFGFDGPLRIAGLAASFGCDDVEPEFPLWREAARIVTERVIDPGRLTLADC